ncbi:hypothetical protein E9531_02265 [Lampropedia puyangensis]|uniref:ABC-type transport auxiliary lipoprotein component domain-containing protein n=1 Tax=Lampropedia puyangensis TaxID=1330072 RepID=A0A4S8FCR2_9BURK|nr:ABC-type transport auxiliary lipoprotein family protein [Lampropedia puyangensis]THU05383.1 hypothetical protein E9531_02265 [Lampropedia puyangensis]
MPMPQAKTTGKSLLAAQIADVASSANLRQRSVAVSAVVAMVWALQGCSALPAPQAAPALYDFGSVVAVAAPSIVGADSGHQGLLLRPVYLAEVTAQGLPDNSQIMLYRLRYSEDLQLRGYQKARWSQPVEQLVEQQLRSQLARSRPVLSDRLNVSFGRNAQSAPAIAYVNLIHFEQAFTGPSTSQAEVQAQVTVVEPSPQGDRLLGQKRFDYSNAAPSADAVGGARALAQAAAQLSLDVDAWITTILNSTPPSSGVEFVPSQSR